MQRILSLLTFVAVGFLPALPAAAQEGSIDEGVFRILVDGSEVGTESFSIRRTGSGESEQIIATAEIRMDVPEGRLDLRPALQVSGQDMAVSAYQIKVSGHEQEEVYVHLDERRFVARVRSAQGQQEREYRAAPGTLLLDTRAAHQYYFVGRRAGSTGATIPVIVPRENRQYDLQASVAGTESVTVAGQEVEARRLRLEGGGATRDLWIDGEGRVLRLEFEDDSFVAIRQELP